MCTVNMHLHEVKKSVMNLGGHGKGEGEEQAYMGEGEFSMLQVIMNYHSHSK